MHGMGAVLAMIHTPEDNRTGTPCRFPGLGTLALSTMQGSLLCHEPSYPIQSSPIVSKIHLSKRDYYAARGSAKTVQLDGAACLRYCAGVQYQKAVSVVLVPRCLFNAVKAVGYL